MKNSEKLMNKILEGAEVRDVLGEGTSQMDFYRDKKLPKECQSLLRTFVDLCEAGNLRWYFEDSDYNENSVDIPEIFNFFCLCEEVGVALRGNDFDKAVSLLKSARF